jgi:cyclopropane fatty-acyl-phospholipid synthase-like methyltransferase
MTGLELLFDFYKDLQRQGPGSTAETKRALDLLEAEKDAPLQALDIGCGTGAQTFVLAEHTSWNITAVDIFPEFLERLEERAAIMGLADRVSVSNQSMDSLSFEEGQFDVIWSGVAAFFENRGRAGGVGDLLVCPIETRGIGKVLDGSLSANRNGFE